MERLIQHKQEIVQTVVNVGSGGTVATMALSMEIQNWFQMGAVIGGCIIVWLQIGLFVYNRFKKTGKDKE